MPIAKFAPISEDSVSVGSKSGGNTDASAKGGRCATDFDESPQAGPTKVPPSRLAPNSFMLAFQGAPDGIARQLKPTMPGGTTVGFLIDGSTNWSNRAGPGSWMAPERTGL